MQQACLFKFTLINLLAVLFFTTAMAAEEKSNPQFSDRLIRAEDNISRGINFLSAEIDQFFSREDTEVENRESRVRIGYAADFIEHEDPGFNFILKARLVLPRTQKKLQFIILSDEEDALNRGETRETTTETNAPDTVRNQKYNVGLRSILRNSRRSGVSLDGGIKVRDPIDPFVRLTARRSFFFEKFELKAIERLYWFDSEGWASSISLDLDRPLNTDWLFRFSNNGVVDHETGLWQVEHFTALYHKYSDRLAIGYFVGVTSDDDPHFHMETYYTTINFRYLLFSDWLYAQAAPRVTWPREKYFTDVPSIYLKIEAIFGG